MRSPKLVVALLSLTLLLVPKMSGDAISVEFFPGTVYSSNTAAMNTAVGVSGDLIDSFDSTTLLPGLSITLSGGNITTPIIETSLPALFDGNTFSSTCFSATQCISANQAWDATDSDEETNTSGNIPNNASTATNVVQLITFNYSPGTTQFGIGLSNFQSLSSPFFPITNHDLIVNATDLGTLESLAGSTWTPGLTRNAYMVITDTGGSITSVGFQNNTALDVLLFGDLAVAPASAPEPSGLVLLGASLVIVGAVRRKRLV